MDMTVPPPSAPRLSLSYGLLVLLGAVCGAVMMMLALG
jgi:hypothetical protein